jgi:hypothetical protein
MQQFNLGFQNMHQQVQSQMNAGLQAFGQQIHNQVYQPLMTNMQNLQQGLHDDVAALDSRFDYLPTSEQHQALVERQQKL